MAINIDPIIKDAIIKLVVDKLLEWILKKGAFLSWGPIPSILAFILSKIVSKAIDFGIIELGAAMIKLTVNKQVKRIEKIVENHKEGNGGLDEELKDAYRDLIKFGSA